MDSVAETLPRLVSVRISSVVIPFFCLGRRPRYNFIQKLLAVAAVLTLKEGAGGRYVVCCERVCPYGKLGEWRPCSRMSFSPPLRQ